MREEPIEIEAQHLTVIKDPDEKVFNYMLRILPKGANFKVEDKYETVYTNTLRINQYMVAGSGFEIAMDQKPIHIEHRPNSYQTRITLEQEQ